MNKKASAALSAIKMRPTPTIAIIACEESGDRLGSALMLKLRADLPKVKFIGVGGKKMEAAGLSSWVDMHQLSVIGLTEAVLKLTRVLRIARKLKHLLSISKPDLFIGIDAPGFNLHMAGFMRSRGCPTIQYVSPTFWAWKENRINTVRRVVNLTLCLYPMEKKRYDQEKIPALFVGHPIADEIGLKNDKSLALTKLGLKQAGFSYIAILPGSRASEIKNLAPVFIATACAYLRQKPKTRFILAAVNAQWANYIQRLLPKDQALRQHFSLAVDQSRQAMVAADCVLLSSGTATLECMLINRPMVVAYKVSPITYLLAKKFLLRTPYISQPNILLNKAVVEEYMQQQVNPNNLSRALLRVCDKPFDLQQDYKRIHRVLRQNASHKAAAAVCEFLTKNPPPPTH